MKDKKEPVSFLNMGTSSLLVIFLVLSIAIFATLALSSAKTDYDFSVQTAAQKEAYYSASNKSEMIIAKIDHFLASFSSDYGSAQEYFDKISSSLDNEIEGVTIYESQDGDVLNLSWQIPFTSSRMLSVVLEIPWPENKLLDNYYRIISWQTVTFDETER